MTRWTTWVIGLVLCGCASFVGAVANLNPGENLGPSESLAVVIGRIVQVEDGKEQKMHSPWYGSPEISMYQVESRQLFSATVADTDGNFYWLLPRGTYLMARYQYRVWPMAPRAAFQVPPGLGAMYVGTLRIEINTVPFLETIPFVGHAQTIQERIAVLDEFEQARTALATRNPQVVQQVPKQLMVHDLLLPPLQFSGSPNWQSIIGVLNKLGLPILPTAH